MGTNLHLPELIKFLIKVLDEVLDEIDVLILN